MTKPDAVAGDRECRHRIGVWGDRSCAELSRYTHCHNCPVYARLGHELLRRAPDADYLEEWRARLAMPAPAQESGRRWVLLFRVGGEWMALPMALVREVINPAPAHRVPHRSHPALLGVIGVRGEHVPCIHIGELIGTAEADTNPSWPRTLILERSGEAWATPVDEVAGAWRLADDELRPPPATVATGAPCFTSGMFRANGRDVALLDADLLLRGCGEACR